MGFSVFDWLIVAAYFAVLAGVTVMSITFTYMSVVPPWQMWFAGKPKPPHVRNSRVPLALSKLSLHLLARAPASIQ